MIKRPARRILGLVAAGVLLVLAGQHGWLAPAKGVFAVTVTPVIRVFASAGDDARRQWEFFTSIKDLSAENQRLVNENSQLRQRLAEDADLRQENENFRRELGFSQASGLKLVPAEVVAYQPDNFRQYITIDHGSRDGITLGQAVISEGSLVGKISEVTPTTAKVFLVIDTNFRINGVDQETRASGTVHGQLGNGLIMDKIAQSDSIKPGDTIVTSGLGGELPRGLVIGRVQATSQTDNAVFQAAQISSALKFNKLELVMVVQP